MSFEDRMRRISIIQEEKNVNFSTGEARKSALLHEAVVAKEVALRNAYEKAKALMYESPQYQEICSYLESPELLAALRLIGSQWTHQIPVMGGIFKNKLNGYQSEPNGYQIVIKKPSLDFSTVRDVKIFHKSYRSYSGWTETRPRTDFNDIELRKIAASALSGSVELTDILDKVPNYYQDRDFHLIRVSVFNKSNHVVVSDNLTFGESSMDTYLDGLAKKVLASNSDWNSLGLQRHYDIQPVPPTTDGF